jgi:hypothetical protein
VSHSDALLCLRGGGASVILNWGYGRGFWVFEIYKRIRWRGNAGFWPRPLISACKLRAGRAFAVMGIGADFIADVIKLRESDRLKVKARPDGHRFLFFFAIRRPNPPVSSSSMN